MKIKQMLANDWKGKNERHLYINLTFPARLISREELFHGYDLLTITK
jgi:hypothetical protein